MKYHTKIIRRVVADDVKNGQEITKARIAAMVTLRGLAKQIGVSAPYLSDMEKGKRGVSCDRFYIIKAALSDWKLL